ncbi:MAG: hypothetical protein RL885_06655 [Planctomycetota bacterium]
MSKKREITDEPQGFLANLDPVRIIIYILIVAVLVFAGFLAYSEWQIKKYEEAYRSGTQVGLKRLFEEYWQVRKLQVEIEATGNDPAAPFNTIVEKAVGTAGLDMIQDEITAGRRTDIQNRREGFVNVNRRLDIGSRKDGAGRQNIFWVLMGVQNNPKYSVTNLRLDAKDLSADRWTATAVVTNREPIR